MSFTQGPDLAGFQDAMDRKRMLLGSVVTFFWPVHYTWGAEVPLTVGGFPLDPMASAQASAQASAAVTASVFFKAINRGGASNADVAEPIGRDQKSRLFVNIASGDEWEHDLSGQQHGSAVSEFEFHGNRFQVYAAKFDEVVQGYKRFLVYGANEGNSK